MEKVITKFSVLVVGGGTKERLIPAMVLAESLRQKGIMLIFGGEPGGIEYKLLGETGYEVVKINPYSGEKGFFKSFLQKIKKKSAVDHAGKVIEMKSVNAVLCLGGFSAIPVAEAAKEKNIPVLIMEQNCVFSPANKEISSYVTKAYVPFEETASGLNPSKFLASGVPVRREILDAAPRNIPTDKKLMTIFTCKKNSYSINELVKSFFLRYPEMRKEFFVIHETGEKDVADLQIFYDKNGIESLCYMHYEGRGKYYKTADLLICRPSSDVVSETMGTGSTAVFVALPPNIEPHHTSNAVVLTRKGCGYIVEDSGSMHGKVKKLYSAVSDFLRNPDRIKRNVMNLQFPVAVRKICNDIERILTGASGR